MRTATCLGLGLLCAGVLLSCSRSEPRYDVGNAQVQGHYDRKTGKLTQITYDRNKNGKTDTWSYMDGTRVVRIEIDENEDGKVDRWEYYTGDQKDQKLEKVGYSRAKSGRPDAWAWQGAGGKLSKIEMAAQTRVGPELQFGAGPAARIVRTEYYDNGVLARVEEDTNADGRTDKWETYRDGAVETVAFDTTGRGTPDRRLVYAKDGTARAEVDPAGTGTFKPVKTAK